MESVGADGRASIGGMKVTQIATVTGGLEAPDGLVALRSDGTLWIRDRDPHKGDWGVWMPFSLPPGADTEDASPPTAPKLSKSQALRIRHLHHDRGWPTARLAKKYAVSAVDVEQALSGGRG